MLRLIISLGFGVWIATEVATPAAAPVTSLLLEAPTWHERFLIMELCSNMPSVLLPETLPVLFGVALVYIGTYISERLNAAP